MQYYLVSARMAAMVGIEQCSIVSVLPAQEAAFQRRFAGRVLIAGCNPAAWPSVPVVRFHSRRPAVPRPVSLSWPIFRWP
jgi:hypothetical protein